MPPFFFFFFNDTATTEIYTLSLHDALPISLAGTRADDLVVDLGSGDGRIVIIAARKFGARDRKSTRLNSSHPSISYAVFCLKKKNQTSPHLLHKKKKKKKKKHT